MMYLQQVSARIMRVIFMVNAHVTVKES
jgi:hypothetical protein